MIGALDAPMEALRTLLAGKPARAPRDSAAPRKPREGTKQEQVLAMLRRPEGATVAQIAEAKAERAGRIAREPDGSWDIDKTRRRLVEIADHARSPVASGAGAEGTPFAWLKVAQLALKVEAQRVRAIGEVTLGEAIYTDLEFPLTTSVSTVQRLMKVALERNRRQRTVAFRAGTRDGCPPGLGMPGSGRCRVSTAAVRRPARAGSAGAWPEGGAPACGPSPDPQAASTPPPPPETRWNSPCPCASRRDRRSACPTTALPA